MKDRKMCKWKKKDLEDNFQDYCKLVAKPKYVCMKCGRVTTDASTVCKAKEIKKED